MKKINWIILLTTLLAWTAGAAAPQDNAIDEGKTPLEWYKEYLPRYRAITKQWHETVSDPEKWKDWAGADTDPVACLQRTQLYLINCHGDNDLLQTQAGETEVSLYRTWQKEQGDALLYKWLKGEPFTAEEEPYRSLVEGSAWLICCENFAAMARKRGYMTAEGMQNERNGMPPEQFGVEDVDGLLSLLQAYVKDVRNRGHLLMRKGYLGEKLTAADLKILAAYCLDQFTHSNFPSTKGGLPYNPEGPGGGGYIIPAIYGRWQGSHPWDSLYPPTHGSLMPPLRFLPLKAAMESPYYSDYYYNNPLLFHKPERVMMLLNRFIGYTAKEEEGEKAVTFAPLPPETEDRPEHIRLTRLQKPLLIVPCMMGDVDGPRMLESFNHLYETYHGQIDFVLLNIQYDDCQPQFYGHIGTDPSRPGTRGLVAPLTIMRSACLEERANLLKARLMEYPSVKLPPMLTDPFQAGYGPTSFGMGQGQRERIYCLVSADGKVVANDMGSGLSHYGYIELPSLTVSYVERAIRRLIRNDGKWFEMEPFYPKEKRQGTYDHPLGCYLGRSSVADAMRIESVDAATRTLAGTRLWTCEPHRGAQEINEPFHFTVDPQTPIRQYSVDIPFENIRPGDTVYFIRPVVKGKYDRSRLIRLQRIVNTGPGFINGQCINTRVLNVNPATREIEAALQMNFEAMTGYRFWKKDAEKTSFRGPSNPGTRGFANLPGSLEVLDRLAGMETIVLTLKPVHRILFNGGPGTIKDIRPGQILSFPAPKRAGAVQSSMEADVIWVSDPRVK